MDVAQRQAHLAGTRDVAVQKLRDLTLAIGIGAAGAVGLVAYIAAATIPGISDVSATGSASAQTADVPSEVSASSGSTTVPSTTQPGPAVAPAPRHRYPPVAVSGGSR